MIDIARIDIAWHDCPKSDLPFLEKLICCTRVGLPYDRRCNWFYEGDTVRYAYPPPILITCGHCNLVLRGLNIPTEWYNNLRTRKEL
jgi:hypothetical protein